MKDASLKRETLQSTANCKTVTLNVSCIYSTVAALVAFISPRSTGYMFSLARSNFSLL